MLNKLATQPERMGWQKTGTEKSVCLSLFAILNTGICACILHRVLCRKALLLYTKTYAVFSLKVCSTYHSEILNEISWFNFHSVCFIHNIPNSYADECVLRILKLLVVHCTQEYFLWRNVPNFWVTINFKNKNE